MDYPNLRLGLLQPLLELRDLYHDDTETLDGAACPYDPGTIEILKSLFGERAEELVETVAEVEVGAGAVGRPKTEHVLKGMRTESSDAVEAELIVVRAELKQLREDAKVLPPNDRIAVIKASVGLIEKLSVLAERQFNIKRMSIFQATIVGILDDLVLDDARAEFMKRLAPFAASE